MISTVVAVTAVAVPIRSGWPARHPSPKKSPGPSTATTASLPRWFTTDSLTPPFWMYSTVLPESPCEKIVSLRLNSTTFRATPADSRNSWASNGVLPLAFSRRLEDRGLVRIRTDACIVARLSLAASYRAKCSLLNRRTGSIPLRLSPVHEVEGLSHVRRRYRRRPVASKYFWLVPLVLAHARRGLVPRADGFRIGKYRNGGITHDSIPQYQHGSVAHNLRRRCPGVRAGSPRRVKTRATRRGHETSPAGGASQTRKASRRKTGAARTNQVRPAHCQAGRTGR